MAAGTTPIFPATPNTYFVQSTAANTNLDGSGTIVDIVTGAANGTRVDEVRSKFQVTTTAGMIRYYIKKSGGSYRLIHEEEVPAITKSATVRAYETVWPCNLLLASSDLLSVSTEIGNACNHWAICGDF